MAQDKARHDYVSGIRCSYHAGKRIVKRLHDYLDYAKVRVITKNGEECIGTPIAVIYADESGCGEDELDIENGKITGFVESEIESIEILDEIED